MQVWVCEPKKDKTGIEIATDEDGNVLIREIDESDEVLQEILILREQELDKLIEILVAVKNQKI